MVVAVVAMVLVKERVRLPKRMNFPKNSKRPLTPPPHFWKLHCAFFAKIRKYALTCVNLQCNFLDRKWPPPPSDFFQKNIQIGERRHPLDRAHRPLWKTYLFTFRFLCNASTMLFSIVKSERFWDEAMLLLPFHRSKMAAATICNLPFLKKNKLEIFEDALFESGKTSTHRTGTTCTLINLNTENEERKKLN